MNETLETCRHLYNRLLAERKDSWEQDKRSLSCFEQHGHIKTWKAGHEWLPRVHSQVLQNIVVPVDLAFAAFFRRVKAGEEPDYPRFKGRGYYDSFTYPQSGFALNADSVTLSKIGTVPAIVHRTLEGKIKTCTVRRQTGKWFACFSIEASDQPLPPSTEVVGIDVGLESFATLSTGEKVENPRFFRQDETTLAKAQRRLSKVAKGSDPKGASARRKRRKVVARLHERIRNRRHNFTHQTARALVKRFGTIAVEKLEPKRMLKNHCLSKSIGDAAWSQFRAVLAHKAASAGRHYAEVNPAYTSQDRHACGYRAKKKLSERWHFCPHCSASLDRDENAALNILALGLQRLEGRSLIEAPGFSRGSSHDIYALLFSQPAVFTACCFHSLLFSQLAVFTACCFHSLLFSQLGVFTAGCVDDSTIRLFKAAP